MLFDVKELSDEVDKELAKDLMKKAKIKIIEKKKEILAARKILKNLERELEDIQQDLIEGFDVE